MRGTYHVQSLILATPARSLARTVARRTCVQDTIYFIGAFFYVFAALRDDGYFWFLPTAGRCYCGCDRRVPMPLPNEKEE